MALLRGMGRGLGEGEGEVVEFFKQYGTQECGQNTNRVAVRAGRTHRAMDARIGGGLAHVLRSPDYSSLGEHFVRVGRI